MPPIELFQLLERASISGSRSTVLNPLLRIVAAIGSIAVAIIYAKGPTWLLVIIAIAFSLVVAMSLVFYVLYALKSPDLLRSERCCG
jgi:hypothetical protein